MFHIVLFEPEIPPNTGNAIRLCANSGATLHLIQPLGFRLDDRSLQRSGLDYHDMADVIVHRDFAACASTLGGSRIVAVETGGARCYSDFAFRTGDALLFGPETRGLPAPVLACIDPTHSLFIPMRPRSRSINLSNAVAIVAFEVWRQLRFSGSAEIATP